ncbi:D-alanyl-D-alanine dipeptidase [Allocatelliglobosispora scoriae]|uniref:D-alanyl-D-alanine dipeptidase n=1 Tax=Allocatelliglobosispora scoriae TaxID=643052 RepID=A0A841BEE0_9ACTN|nr:M15 family metallopeptidase [Allocatelliglobosispora scoriae]MBB5867457.1 D-alanyl-D-alanine dipeptidase [Allocatelliglobosispora scoriae]
MSDIMLLGDQAISAIAVHECGEPLQDLRRAPALRLDPRLADPAGEYAHLRAGVVDRLVTAQTMLPIGIRLLIVEGYRPLEVQADSYTLRLDNLTRAHPHRNAAWLRQETSRFVAPPEVSGHVAGAAVDLTLCDADGAELWLGSQLNDIASEACYTDCADLPPQARRHRNELARALQAVGLVNYPTQWWHWSYGDRYWAFHTGAQAARYATIARWIQPDDAG